MPTYNPVQLKRSFGRGNMLPLTSTLGTPGVVSPGDHNDMQRQDCAVVAFEFRGADTVVDLQDNAKIPEDRIFRHVPESFHAVLGWNTEV